MKALTGAFAVAFAIKQINPDVMAIYPITPQTPIVMKYAQYVADGLVDTEMIRVESEHSALSAVVGSAKSGARSMTATSSAGLALMHEVMGIASGLRCPIVMPVVNRALSGPINIHCDHSDVMPERDSSWITFFCENPQEAYDFTIIATKLAEKILLPAMVCQDGFFTSHAVENCETIDDKKVKDFVGEYTPLRSLLDIKNPHTIGPLQLYDYFFETKRQQHDAMQDTLKEYKEITKEYEKISGRKYEYFEEYKLNDAEDIIVAMSSIAGTIKEVVDNLRKEGKKVGLLKINMFRPFPYSEVEKALSKAKNIAVLDRSASFGAYPPLYTEIKNSLNTIKNMQSYVFGLGGRDTFEKDIVKVFKDINKKLKPQYLGVR